MAFIKNEIANNMTISEKYKFWVSSLKGAEKALMILEGFFMFCFCVFFITSIEVPENMRILAYPIACIFAAIGGVLVFILVEMQRVAFSQSVSALATKQWSDDILFIIISISITGIIWYIDLKGGAKFLNFTNAYDPKIGSIETDVRVKSNDSQRKTIEQERAQKDKALTCSECVAIRAKYESKITNERSNMRKNESDAAWKVSENNKIRNEIARLQSKRDAEIAFAESKFQDYKNGILEKYDSRLMSIDTMQIRVKASIDSANLEENNKQKVQVEENQKYGGYLTWITQILLILSLIHI